MNFHPDVLAYYAQVAADFPPPATAHTAESARALHRAMGAKLGPVRTMKAVRDFTVPGPTRSVACRLYSDRDAEASMPLLIFLHGGGWIGGDLDTHDVLCRELAYGGKCGVVAVDYCLAPENKFPKPFEECLAVCTYILDHCGELGIDPDRIAIGGESAGGNLAAAVVQALKERAGTKPGLQLLIYPLTDFRMATPAYTELNAPGFSLAEATWCANQYLSVISDVHDVRASPALSTDLSGLPPAFVVTAEFDVLRDDGEAYALALAKAGVPVQLRRFLRVPHAFLSMPPSLGVTSAGLDVVCSALREAFAENPA